MKVFELIDKLKELPKFAKIIMASDEEGNGFQEIDDIAPDEEAKKTTFIIWPAEYINEETHYK